MVYTTFLLASIYVQAEAQQHTRTATITNMHTYINTCIHTKTSVCGFPLWASNPTLSSFCHGFSFPFSRFFELPGTLFQTHMLMFLQDLDTHRDTEHPARGEVWPRLTYMLTQAGSQGGADGKPGPVPYDFNLHWTFTGGDTNINMLHEDTLIQCQE